MGSGSQCLPRLLAAFTAILLSSTAYATAQRTFVASTGNDAWPCSVTQPCRQFAAAVAQTNAGGEVIVLDSAGYGAVSLTPSITITAPPGVYGGISVFSGDGISVNGTDVVVTLRGLTIVGLGGTYGIHFVSGAVLHIEHCEISGFFGLGHSGIQLDAPGARIDVIDTVVRDNQNGIVVGAQDNAHTVTVTVSRARLSNNFSEGVLLLGSTQFLIEDSVVAGSQYNIDAFNQLTLATVSLAIIRTSIHHGNYGIYLEPNASGVTSASVVDSTITDQSVMGIAVIPLCASCYASAAVTRTQVNYNSVGIMCDGANASLVSAASVLIDAVTVINNNSFQVKAQNHGTIVTRQNNTASTIDTISGQLVNFPAD